MRRAILVLWTFLSGVVWADSPLCGDTKPPHADLLTAAQWQSVLDGKPAGDPIVMEAIDQEKKKYDEAAPISNPSPIQWEQARKLVLLGVVRTTFQLHDLTVRLVTASGRWFVTREPRIDEIYRVAAVVDPCHVYIRHVTE
jgi:hypothetical protein